MLDCTFNVVLCLRQAKPVRQRRSFACSCFCPSNGPRHRAVWMAVRCKLTTNTTLHAQSCVEWRMVACMLEQV